MSTAGPAFWLDCLFGDWQGEVEGTMRFRDRQDAGRRLAAVLEGFKGRTPVVLGVPRGGVPVAWEVAAQLEAPLDLLLVRKIGLPWQPELAMGAVADGGVVIRNEDVIHIAGVAEADFDAALAHERLELDRRRHCYLGSRPRVELEGRVVIVVDDGIATGATIRAALQALAASKPAQIVLAVPVAAASAISSLKRHVTEVVCLQMPEDFDGIGSYYEDFRQLTDDDVRRFLSAETATKASLGASHSSPNGNGL